MRSPPWVPELAAGPGRNTATLVQVLADQKDGLHTLLVQGNNAFGQVNNLVTTQSANFKAALARRGRRGGQTSRSRPTWSNSSEGSAHNQDFFGAVNQIAVAGAAKATTDGQPAIQNQVFLRTRLIILPIFSPAYRFHLRHGQNAAQHSPRSGLHRPPSTATESEQAPRLASRGPMAAPWWRRPSRTRTSN